MTKRLIALTAALILCAAFFTGCAPDPKGILEQYFTAQKNTGIQNYMATGNLSLGMASGGEAIDMNVELLMSQIDVESRIDMRMSAQAAGSDLVNMREFILTDGQEMTIYLQEQDMWYKMTQAYSDQDVSAVMLGLQPADYESMTSVRYLNKQTIREREAHHIEYKLQSDTVKTLIDQLIAGMGVDSSGADPELVQQFCDSVIMEIWIDTERYQPLKVTMRSEEGMTLDMQLLAITSLSCEIECYDYNDAQTMPLPEGAENAVDYDTLTAQEEATPVGETGGTADSSDPAAGATPAPSDVLDDITGADIPDGEGD